MCDFACWLHVSEAPPACGAGFSDSYQAPPARLTYAYIRGPNPRAGKARHRPLTASRWAHCTPGIRHRKDFHRDSAASSGTQPTSGITVLPRSCVPPSAGRQPGSPDPSLPHPRSAPQMTDEIHRSSSRSPRLRKDTGVAPAPPPGFRHTRKPRDFPPGDPVTF